MAQSQYIAVDTPKGTRPLVSVKVSDLGDNPTLASNGVEKTETSTTEDGGNEPTGTSSSQGIQIIRIKLVSVSPVTVEKEGNAREDLAQSTVGKDLRELLKGFGKPVEAGKLSNTAELLDNLASLQESYATKPNPKASYVDAADLTETQWEMILFNNRLLHGYYFDDTNGILMKAPKRAFVIKRSAKTPDPTRGLISSNIPTKTDPNERTVVPSKTTDAPGVREYLNTLPGIPLFHVHDDSNITVVETATAFQKKIADQGFNSTAVEANMSAQVFGSLISASGSWQDEKSHDIQDLSSEKQTSLRVAYKFPRVVVDLSPEYLQLSDECWNDILQITDLDGVDRFARQYGNAFSTQIMLGGLLHSSRHVAAKTTDHLEKIKIETKTAAGVSFASPKVNLGVNYANSKGNEDENSSGAGYKNANLAWEARGGDTTLCSNPPEWANTVKDYRNWRITEQSHLLSLKDMISRIDYLLYQRLEYPSNPLPTATAEDQNKALIIAFSKLVAANDPKLKTLAVLFASDNKRADFDAWLRKKGRNKQVLGEQPTWDKLSPDQKIFYGLYAVEKKTFSDPTPKPKT